MVGESFFLKEFGKLKKDVAKINNRTHKVEHKLELTIVTALTAALAFVIALSWNETIRAFTDSILYSLGISGFGVPYRILESVLITLICVSGIYFLSRFK